MTIKDKLNELEIDIEKNKQLVDDIKKALANAGENASKITNKLTSDGEKIVQTLVNKSKVNMPKKNVLRPTTIRIKGAENKDKNTAENEVSNSENTAREVSDEKKKVLDTKPEQSSKPFWESNTSDNLKINIKGKTKEQKKNTSSPNGRPLPQSTIEELKRKSEENRKKNVDIEQKSGNENVRINKTNMSGKPSGSQQNRFQNQNRNQQNRFNKDKPTQKPKASNFDGGNIKSTFNPGNASIATGTNNKFTGKKKKENKYNKDNEKQKQNKKGSKDKFDKYNKNLLTYDGEEKVRTKTKTGAGAFQKPEPKLERPEDEIKSIINLSLTGDEP